MRERLASLVIDKFIVHDVPSKYSVKYLRANPEQRNLEPVLSDIETPFSETLRSFFHDKLSASIGSSNSFDIKYYDSNGTVPTQVDLYFSDNSKDIEASQEIAKHLYNTQDAKNSGGLLLFVLCHVGTTRALAILKVEREEGVQISKQNTNDGHIRFNMEHIENLMLTKNTKLFKIVLFYRENNETKGILSDQQMGFNIGKEVATYFLRNFLGCDLKEDPTVTTKKFLESTQTFINNSDMHPSNKASAVIHLLSTLTSNTNTINVHSFAETYLDVNHADDYLTYMNEQGIPNTSFVKDLSLISNKISRSRFIFDSGIFVIAPQSTINEKLNYQPSDNGQIKMEIVDTLKKVALK